MSDFIMRCPLIPDAEPMLVSVGMFWNVEAHSASGVWVMGESWMDKGTAIHKWNELMANYPGSKA